MEIKKRSLVHLYRRKLSDGRQALHLVINDKGKRRYEFLKMYLVVERTAEDRRQNRETLRTAEAIRAKRIVEIQNNEYGFRTEKKKLFFPYFERFIATYEDKTRKLYECVLKHLRSYGKEDMLIQDITPEWINGFIEYLRTKGKLADISVWVYVSKLKAVVHNAIKEEIISRDPFISVQSVTYQERERCYLTIEELQQLAETECPNKVVKRMFLFSALTGLRWGDVAALRWDMVTEAGGMTRITFSQQKTKGLMYLDITPEAVELMGERGEGIVFEKISLSVTDIVLKAWAAKAGITKKVSFHVARHTFATMMLSLGTDLYTVSKLLGHTQISTTQIYAKIMDKAKQEAVMKIPRIRK